MLRFSSIAWIIVLCVSCWSRGSATAAESVTLASLLHEMVDRDQLAKLPQPSYSCRQASSYDRGTVAADQPGWFANMDRSWFLRTEQHDGRTEHVMLDAKGPGAIVRIWATWHGPGGGEFSNGTLRFYLDGDPEPVLAGPIADIIDRGALVEGCLSQGVSPQTEYRRRGHNLYLPIPYAKHCKVTYETSAPIDDGGRTGEALYYQINYRTYAADTAVQTFHPRQLDRLRGTIDQVQQRLVTRAPQRAADSPDTHSQSNISTTLSWAGSLAAGESRSLVLDAPGAIRELTVNVQADNLAQALRSTVLQIDCDGTRTVWCPVGAFFGRGYQSQPHRTWYTEVHSDGTMRCYWVMPFQRACRIQLTNTGDQPVTVQQTAARVGPWQWDERSMYFHATWRQLTKVSSFVEGAVRPGEGAFDVNYVTVDGQGVYVGDTLTVFNGANAWWGEGDEKIYVDGEAFPSHVGTGTEDYYGYAWCRPEFFESPFHAQPNGAGNMTAGYSVNSRYRALDAIPFESSLRFDMELWHWQQTTMNYAPATFWYARPGASSNVPPAPDTTALPVALQRSDIVDIYAVPGVLEGEQLDVLEMTGGEREVQALPPRGTWQWSNEAQLWWRDAALDDRLVLEFPVSQAGTYTVLAQLTKAIDYGIVTMAINDQRPIRLDGFHDGVVNQQVTLGEYALPAGKNRLTVTITGAHEDAVKRHMFGLDYLLLKQ